MVMTVGIVAAPAVIAFGHAPAGIAVVQAEGMADFLTLHALDIGARPIVVRIILGMGMCDFAPTPFMPPIKTI
jgi:hypothetical protein